MDHSEEAKRLFREGYNCSQAVFCAFCDETGMDIDQAAMLSSSFGGGIGRLREVCGAVSGALLALGMLIGYSDPNEPEEKIRHYRQVQAFSRLFSEKNGSIVCRDLLKDIDVAPGLVPEPRTPEFYLKRPCLRLIGDAAAILDEMLSDDYSEYLKEDR